MYSYTITLEKDRVGVVGNFDGWQTLHRLVPANNYSLHVTVPARTKLQFRFVDDTNHYVALPHYEQEMLDGIATNIIEAAALINDNDDASLTFEGYSVIGPQQIQIRDIPLEIVELMLMLTEATDDSWIDPRALRTEVPSTPFPDVVSSKVSTKESTELNDPFLPLSQLDLMRSRTDTTLSASYLNKVLTEEEEEDLRRLLDVDEDDFLTPKLLLRATTYQEEYKISDVDTSEVRQREYIPAPVMEKVLRTSTTLSRPKLTLSLTRNAPSFKENYSMKDAFKTSPKLTHQNSSSSLRSRRDSATHREASSVRGYYDLSLIPPLPKNSISRVASATPVSTKPLPLSALKKSATEPLTLLLVLVDTPKWHNRVMGPPTRDLLFADDPTPKKGWAMIGEAVESALVGVCEAARVRTRQLMHGLEATRQRTRDKLKDMTKKQGNGEPKQRATEPNHRPKSICQFIRTLVRRPKEENQPHPILANYREKHPSPSEPTHPVIEAYRNEYSNESLEAPAPKRRSLYPDPTPLPPHLAAAEDFPQTTRMLSRNSNSGWSGRSIGKTASHPSFKTDRTAGKLVTRYDTKLTLNSKSTYVGSPRPRRRRRRRWLVLTGSSTEFSTTHTNRLTTTAATAATAITATTAATAATAVTQLVPVPKIPMDISRMRPVAVPYRGRIHIPNAPKLAPPVDIRISHPYYLENRDETDSSRIDDMLSFEFGEFRSVLSRPVTKLYDTSANGTFYTIDKLVDLFSDAKTARTSFAADMEFAVPRIVQ